MKLLGIRSIGITLIVSSSGLRSASVQTIQFGIDATPEHARRAVVERILPHHTDAVLEVRYDSASFEVTRSHHGSLQTGERLPFSESREVLVIGSTEAFLIGLMEDTPILDVPITFSDREVTLDSTSSLDMLPTPGRDARFVVLTIVRPRSEGRWWGFANQTLTDTFLVQAGKVYFHVHGRHDGGTRDFWVPFGPAPSYSLLLSLLEEGLNAGRE